MFTLEEFRDFAASMGIKLLNSSPYYAQANGQAKASNQIMIKLIKKKIEEQPRKWHSTLSSWVDKSKKIQRGDDQNLEDEIERKQRL